jgi:hypothetical protein
MTRAISAGLVLVILGRSAPPAPTAPERLPLRHLAFLYDKFRSGHRGQPPKDTGLDANQLSAAGVSAAEIDTLFMSPRDGQPYEIRDNDPPPADGPNGPSDGGVERVGKNGMRLVAYSTATSR